MRRWWAFAPFAVVGLVHLTILVLGIDAWSTPTKALLMPALLTGFLVALPTRRTELALVGTIAIVLSWAGDLLLSTPGNVGFLVGLGSFMLAHATYIVLFRRALRTRRMPLLALIFAAWWVALVFVLAPHLGVLLVPVAFYGVVLGLSAATALGSYRVVAIGALLFLLSDTILAFKMFWPDFSMWQADFVIMVGYLAGQGLIAVGAVRHAEGLQRAVVR
ncbi:MAG: lysoplasmalogenase [Rhodoglobus sp.]|nr:lysoplasmalogenase [Rhodoglobus sp.]